VTDEAAAIDLHGVQQGDDILDQTGGVDGVGRLRVWVLALPEPNPRKSGALTSSHALKGGDFRLVEGDVPPRAQD
jgi:hypothetical protein